MNTLDPTITDDRRKAVADYLTVAAFAVTALVYGAFSVAGVPAGVFALAIVAVAAVTIAFIERAWTRPTS